MEIKSNTNTAIHLKGITKDDVALLNDGDYIVGKAYVYRIRRTYHGKQFFFIVEKWCKTTRVAAESLYEHAVRSVKLSKNAKTVTAGSFERILIVMLSDEVAYYQEHDEDYLTNEYMTDTERDAVVVKPYQIYKLLDELNQVRFVFMNYGRKKTSNPTTYANELANKIGLSDYTLNLFAGFDYYLDAVYYKTKLIVEHYDTVENGDKYKYNKEWFGKPVRRRRTANKNSAVYNNVYHASLATKRPPSVILKMLNNPANIDKAVWSYVEDDNATKLITTNNDKSAIRT